MRWYTQFPKTLFRLSPNGTTKLRDYALRKSDSFDVQPINGLVQPLDDMTKYTGPNGASMRPLNGEWAGMVKRFGGKKVVVYEIPEGTELPAELILVHEHSDHWSLQPRVPMDIPALNTMIDTFFQHCATAYQRDKYVEKLNNPDNTQACSSSSVVPPPQTQAHDSSYIWSEQYQKYYYVDEAGQTHWISEPNRGGAASRPTSSHSTSGGNRGQTGKTSQKGKTGQKG